PAPRPRRAPGRAGRAARARTRLGRSGRRARPAPSAPTARPGRRAPRRRDGRGGGSQRPIFARRGQSVQVDRTGPAARANQRRPHSARRPEAAGRERAMERLSRRSFVKIAGGAAGAAALAAAPPIARAAVGEVEAQPTHPKTRVPEEPLVAYVRNAERGEVTVAAGTTE